MGREAGGKGKWERQVAGPAAGDAKLELDPALGAKVGRWSGGVESSLQLAAGLHGVGGREERWVGPAPGRRDVQVA